MENFGLLSLEEKQISKNELVTLLMKRKKKYSQEETVKPQKVHEKEKLVELDFVIEVKKNRKTINTFTTNIASMPENLLFSSTLRVLFDCLESSPKTLIESRKQPIMVYHDAPGNGKVNISFIFLNFFFS